MKESVGAIIYFKNLYLIQKRSLKRNIYFPGIFGVFGGNVNKKEKVHQAIFREIKEELDIDLQYYQVKYFLKISINSKHFKKNRSRFYYSINITHKFAALHELALSGFLDIHYFVLGYGVFVGVFC